jgi:hypothetical protein
MKASEAAPMCDVLAADELQARLPVPAQPHLAVLASIDADELHLEVARIDDAPHPRVLELCKYLRYAYSAANASGIPLGGNGIVFQGDDCPLDLRSFSWQSRRGWAGITLVPDLYYFQSRGYEAFRPPVADWWSREDVLLWRGWSTGLPILSRENLSMLPRFRLAEAAAGLQACDVGLVGVAQAQGPQESAAIQAQLQQLGYWREYIPLPEMARARFLVDIDGNANSWGVIARFSLGCCVLKVESQWTQWISPQFTPWRHYVPVSSDLHDLGARLDWCRQHPHVAARIAKAGRRLALKVRFEDEMLRAGSLLFGLGAVSR